MGDVFNHYIVDDDHNVVPVDLMTWARFFQEWADKRRVGRTEGDGWEVSTVFLGLDHNFTKEGPPLIFETLVFGGPLADEMERCSTWDQAVRQHEEMVERCVMASKYNTTDTE